MKNNNRPRVCIKTGRPVVHDVICKMCHRRCPHAGKQGRKRASISRKI